MPKFQESLSIGLKIEEQVLQKLQVKYKSATIVTAYKGYDIWIPEIHKSVEVKQDYKSKHTGNIVVEIEMYGKPSGLLTSTADFWVFSPASEEFISIKTKRIFECILMNNLKQHSFVGKGDTVSKTAYLIEKDLLFSYGNPL
jgi:hypothetical protein